MGSDFPVEIPVIDNPFAPGRALLTTQNPNNGLPTLPEPSNDGARYYTIQRVNGNGANGKGDGTAGAHKHTLEDSDKVKKSSLHRHFLKEEKERRKSMVSRIFFCVCTITGNIYHWKGDLNAAGHRASNFRMKAIRNRLHVIEAKNHLNCIRSPHAIIFESFSKVS